MKICGISIGKRRVELALVKHYDYVNLKGGNEFHLERQQTIFVPKYFMENPLSIDYPIRNLDIFKEADFVHILHGSDKKTKEETVAIKHVIYLLLTEHLQGIKKPFYTEAARVLQSRMGSRKNFSYQKVLDWLLIHVDNLNRQMVMGRRGVMIRKTMAIAAACDNKRTKYDR